MKTSWISLGLVCGLLFHASTSAEDPAVAAEKKNAEALSAAKIPELKFWDFKDVDIASVLQPKSLRYNTERKELTVILVNKKDITVFDKPVRGFAVSFYDEEMEKLEVVYGRCILSGRRGDEEELTFEVPSKKTLEKTKKVIVRNH
jgi:hypothetical protein